MSKSKTAFTRACVHQGARGCCTPRKRKFQDLQKKTALNHSDVDLAHSGESGGVELQEGVDWVQPEVLGVVRGVGVVPVHGQNDGVHKYKDCVLIF